MKECFAITTYCDSEKKVNILLETIKNLKQFGVDILIHAHYPLEMDIQKMVNFYYYSSDNPILNRYNVFWYAINKYNLEYKSYDVSYTVMKQWKEIINILSEYDVIHFVNYDANILPELYDLTKQNILEKNKSIFYENFETANYIHVIYFSLLRKDFTYFSSFLTKDKVLSFPYSSRFLPSIEEYVKSFLNENFYIIPIIDYNVYIEKFLENEINIIDGLMRYTKLENGYYEPYIYFLQFSNKDAYNIFIGYYNDKLTGFVSDIKKELKFEIDNQLLVISNNCEYFMFNLNGQIKIEDELISEEFINKFLKLECKILNKNE